MDDVGTLVAGAGVIGSAVAMHLAEMGSPDVHVVDPDLEGAYSSSERNAGGVRANWWQPVNVALAAATIDWLAEHRDEVGLRQEGYLWLYDAELWPAALEHVRLQVELGRHVDLLSPRDVERRFPMIDRLAGIAGATHTPADGLVNANGVKEALRRRARVAGARFVDRSLLVGVERRGARVVAAWVRGLADEAAAEAALTGAAPDSTAQRVGVDAVVNACGPWAAGVAAMLGGPSHSRPVRRQLSLVASRGVDLAGQGMIVDTSGVYLHHEAGETILAGYSPPGDPPGIDFTYDGRAFFEAEIWPRLAERMSGMDRMEHLGGWAGMYEMSEDSTAVLGKVPGLENAFEAHSFSGRGVMQSWAAGRALAELMVSGAFQSIDASDLTVERFASGRRLTEPLHI